MIVFGLSDHIKDIRVPLGELALFSQPVLLFLDKHATTVAQTQPANSLGGEKKIIHVLT